MNCDICGKEFDEEINLNRHIKMAHGRTEELKTEESRDRKKRVPLGVPKLKLSANVRPGKKGRWLNDDGARINEGLDGGYEFERDSEGRKIKRVVGKRDDGSDITSYLMSIDEEFYKEDQAAKQAEIDQVEAQIYSGKHDEKPGENRYVPKDGMNVQVSQTP